MPASLVPTQRAWHGVQVPTYPILSYAGQIGLSRVPCVCGIYPTTRGGGQQTARAWCGRDVHAARQGRALPIPVQRGVVSPILTRAILVSMVAHGWSQITDHVTYLSVRPDPDRVLPAGYVYPLLLKNLPTAAPAAPAKRPQE